jgi:hypothetical protein
MEYIILQDLTLTICAQDHTPVLQSITISRNPQQDAAMQAIISNSLGTPRPYNVLTNNCATFVEDVLRAGGLQVPTTRFPNDLMKHLRQAYGRPPSP